MPRLSNFIIREYTPHLDDVTFGKMREVEKVSSSNEPQDLERLQGSSNMEEEQLGKLLREIVFIDFLFELLDK